jgi:hypothetical protein
MRKDMDLLSIIRPTPMMTPEYDYLVYPMEGGQTEALSRKDITLQVNHQRHFHGLKAAPKFHVDPKSCNP